MSILGCSYAQYVYTSHNHYNTQATRYKSLNSMAGQRNPEMHGYGQLKHAFSKTLPVCIQLTFCLQTQCKPRLSQLLSFPTVFPNFQANFLQPITFIFSLCTMTHQYTNYWYHFDLHNMWDVLRSRSVGQKYYQMWITLILKVASSN